MTKSQSREIDFLEGPLIKNILMFTLPVLATGVLQFLYNASDSAVVGWLIGSNALGAVSSTGALSNLITGLFIGLSVGASVSISHSVGSRRFDDAHDTVQTSISISCILGVLVAAFGFFACKPLLTLMGTVDECLDQSVRYMRIIFIGMPAQMIYNYGTSILRANGDTRHPLEFLVISGAVNVVCNIILVYFFRDVWCVAAATIISQYLSAVLALRLLCRIEGCCRLDIRHLYVRRDKFMKILRIGLPAGVQSVLFSFSNVIIQSSINSFQNAAIVAGNGAAANVDGLIYIAQNSFYHTALTFTGQNLGGRRFERIRSVCRSCLILVCTVGLAIGGICYAFGPQLLSIFARDDTETIKYGMVRLLYMGIPYFLCGTMEVMSGMLRGLGASMTSMIVSLLGACVFRVIWIATVFKTVGTLESIYISFPISWLLTTLAAYVCYRIVFSRIKRRLEAQTPHTDPDSGTVQS
ncbi:MAG: MATE family efflux transporter [Clostridiales bacterium]|nr:MATE family efflux transporter [Clostridiales bacterium]